MQKTPSNSEVSQARSQAAGDKNQSTYFIRLGEEQLSTHPQNALGSLSQAVEISLRLQQPELIIKSYCSLGKAYSQLKRLSEALTQYHNALAVAKTCGLEQSDILYLLYETYKAQKDYKNALKYHEARYKKQPPSVSANNAIITLKHETRVFLRHVVHDIKAPIRIISNYNQLLKKSIKEVKNEATLDYLNYTEGAIKRINALVKSFSNYIAIDVKQPQFDAVDLNEVLELARNNLDTMIKNTKAIIKADSLTTVQADFELMAQVFEALIANALIYKKVDQVPQINITTTKHNRHFQFSIQDTGTGINSSQAETLFDIASGPKKHKNNPYASGMGLIICKKIIDKHKGNIWVESKQGEGSTFYFTLPIISDESLT